MASQTKTDIYPWLLWIALILQGLVFVGTTAIWDGFDEPFHYAYIQQLAEHGSLPVYGTSRLSREVTRSFELAPLSPAFNSILAGRFTTFASFWQLPEEERAERTRALRALGKDDRTTPGSASSMTNYEAHHAPLYYLVAAPVYRLCASLDLPTRIACLRLFSLLLGSITIFAAYAAACRALPDSWGPRALVFLLALTPMMAGTIARISNDALAVPLGSLAAFFTIEYFACESSPRRALQLGMTLGLGLLSKAYFLAILAAVIAAFVVVVFASPQRKRYGRHMAIVLGLAAGISGWWYARNMFLYGNLSGLQEVTLTGSLSLGDRLSSLTKVPWGLAWHSMFKQHIWLGNMSLLELSRTLYRIGYLLSFAALLGWGVRALAVMRRRRVESEMSPGQARALGVAGILYAFFLLAAAYHMWQSFILVQRTGGTGGYYLFAVIVPELLLLISGFMFLPWGAGRLAQGSTVVYVVLVNFVAYFCKAIPHYAGIPIPRFHLSHLWQIYSPAAFPQVLQRITAQQATWLGPMVLGGILACHLVWMIWVTWKFFMPVTHPRNGE